MSSPRRPPPPVGRRECDGWELHRAPRWGAWGAGSRAEGELPLWAVPGLWLRPPPWVRSWGLWLRPPPWSALQGEAMTASGSLGRGRRWGWGSSERGARERRRPRRPFRRVWERGLLSAVPQRRTTWGSRHGAGRPPGRVARPCLPPAGCRGDRVPSPASVLLWPPLQAPVSPAPHRLRDRQPCGVTAEGRVGRSRASRWSSAPSSGSEAQVSRPHVPVTVLVCGHLP